LLWPVCILYGTPFVDASSTMTFFLYNKIALMLLFSSLALLWRARNPLPRRLAVLQSGIRLDSSADIAVFPFFPEGTFRETLVYVAAPDKDPHPLS